jgi:hypothetical protein
MTVAPDTETSIKLVQLVLKMHHSAPGTNLLDALDAVVNAKAWQERSSSRGSQYELFGDFAIDRQPFGLGVGCSSSFKMIRFALLYNHHYREHADLLNSCLRPPGRPRNNIAGDEGFYLVISTSRNSIDRILMTLRRNYPAEFELVCNGDLPPREAARRVGLLPFEQRREFGVCDLTAVGALPERAQGGLLLEVFKAVGVDAQCNLFSRTIEPKLGNGLAERWRKLASDASSQEQQ